MPRATGSITIRRRPKNGLDGEPGGLPTMRRWVEGQVYYRGTDAVDYIIYRESSNQVPTWWRLKRGVAEAVAGKTPALSPNFEQISSFEAIATVVLLAEEANLAEFIFKEGQLISQATTNGVRNIILNGRTGYAHFAASNIIMNVDGSVEVLGKYMTAKTGKRFVLDPASQTLRGYNSSNQKVLDIEFGDLGAVVSTYSYPNKTTNTFNRRSVMSADGIGVQGVGTLLYSIGGGVQFQSLPTSSSGLTSGHLWRDGTTLKIVP